MKKLILLLCLFSLNVMARSGQNYNTYSCKDKSSGYVFLLIQESKYDGLNTTDKDSKTSIFIRSLGKFNIDNLENIKLEEGNQIFLMSHGQQEEGMINLELNLRPRKLVKKKSTQFVKTLKGEMILNVENENVKINLVTNKVICKRML